MTTEPQIYVACLAAYNNGILHGKWIDLTQDLDSVWDEIKAMLKSSPIPDSEEYAIHDYEGFESYRLSEYEGIERAHKLAEFISEHGRIGGMLLNHFGGELDEARTAIEEQYTGEYKSVADFAEELTEQTTQVPENIAFYIDYDRMGRDMEMSGDIFTLETRFEEVHVFWSR